MAERIIMELTSADIPGALQAAAQRGIEMWDVVQTGELTIRFTVAKSGRGELSDIMERRGDRLRQIRRLGLSRRLRLWGQHPLLVLGIAVLLCLTVWLPTRVLFVQVEGNDRLPANLILTEAENCGIRFGSTRSQVRSERMKNALLDALPQLQWAGINTAGCVATITVRERSLEPEPEAFTASSIVAARDGVIRTCTVHRGTALCAPGQAVRAGEVLISGLTDCGLSILATRADGEVFAETSRQILTQTPENALVRGGEIRIDRKFSLMLGKNRINFYKDSGILDATCVKMYSEYYITLPGGFQLPLGIAVETAVWYDSWEDTVDDGTRVMEDYARQYLLSHMTAGQILEERTTAEGNRLYADYICLEMIGQIRYEEITKEDGENYGENG